MTRYGKFAALPHLFAKLFIFTLCVISPGCDSEELEPEPEPEVKCDNYFLKSEKSISNIVSRYFYNNRGKLEIIEGEDTNHTWQTELTYNVNDQLIEVNYDGGYKTNFFYEGGLLRSTKNTDAQGGEGNEMKFYYDDENRLIRREIYRPESGDEIYNYFEMEYPAAGKVEATFYTVNAGGGYDEGATFKYTIDENPRPYPEEYYLMWISWSNVLLLHNELSLQIFRNGTLDGASGTTYEYNEQGYPVLNSNGTMFTYSCEPTPN
jgi:hypothetical protein